MLKIDKMHPMEEYMHLLSSSLTIYMDEDRLDRAYREACYAADDLKALALLWLRIESGGMYSSLSPDNIIDFLLRIGVDEKRLSHSRSKKLSLDMKKVVTPLIDSGVAPELLLTYKEYRSYCSYASSLSSLIDAKRPYTITPSGRKLVQFPTHIEERDNLRVYYHDIAVVSVPKKYSNMITGPSDKHFIAWCDYPQADWRFAYNLFIRDEKNEQIMRQCTDAYEGLARLVEGENFSLEEFKEKRNEFKTNCLKVFYNSKDNSPTATAIREFYRSCPKYYRLLYDLGVLYQFKLPIPCTSYFGYEQLLPEGPFPDAFIAKGLNTPIQTFTSHIVNETVFGVLEKFWELGYTKEQANVYYVRHDEPLFLFTKDVIKDAWVFKECSEIFIPGFTPIHLDFHFGTYYQEEDPRLTMEINNAIEASNHTYAVYEGGEAKDYYPLPSVESVYAQVFTHGSNLCVKFYNYRTSERRDFVVDADNSEDALHLAMEQGALDWLGNPQYLLVKNSGMSFINYVGQNDSTLMKVIDNYDSSVAVSS